ncbi:MAG TPA: hypothetical protein VKX17_23225 [Planctomycetota bacterium]|nr:hypothetical protein [Planctomycetota bacterium]
MSTIGSDAIQKTVEDLKACLGSALIIGGLAVIHHGYERYTNDVDILYAHADGSILKRLSAKFKCVQKAKNGWHKLAHRKTGVRLELIPEGDLTTYGFIPGPHFFGSDNGFLPLWGLIWLKLVSRRAKDQADVVELAKIRMNDVLAARSKLPDELLDCFDELIATAKREIENDPNNGPAEAE